MGKGAISTTSALSLPWVRRRLRRRAVCGISVAVATVILFTAFVLAANWSDNRARELEVNGLRVSAVVVEYSGNPGLRGHRVTVEYSVPGGTPQQARIELDDNAERYEVGRDVTVIVDPRPGGRVSLPGQNNERRWSTNAMLVALVGSFVGAVVAPSILIGQRRLRRTLASGPWRRVYIEVAGERAAVFDNGAVLAVQQRDSVRGAFGRAGLVDATEAQIVGPIGRWAVIRPIDAERYLGVRVARTDRAARRWLSSIRKASA